MMSKKIHDAENGMKLTVGVREGNCEVILYNELTPDPFAYFPLYGLIPSVDYIGA
jgi:hypothetical protein